VPPRCQAEGVLLLHVVLINNFSESIVDSFFTEAAPVGVAALVLFHDLLESWRSSWTFPAGNILLNDTVLLLLLRPLAVVGGLRWLHHK